MKRFRSIGVLLVLMTATAFAGGCGGVAKSAAPATATSATAPSEAAIEASVASDPNIAAQADTAGVPFTPAEEITLARSMGKSHQGEKLFALLRSTYKTEAEATKALTDALPRFGDTVTYFVIEPTAHLSGLAPGSWVVAEFFRAQPPKDVLAFDGAGAPDARVVQVTVTCTDPIAVFEDQLPPAPTP